MVKSRVLFKPKIVRYIVRLVILLGMAFLPFLGGQVVHADDVNIQDVLSQNNGTATNNSTSTIMPLAVENTADPSDIASGTFGDADWNIDANGKLSINSSNGTDVVLPKLLYPDGSNIINLPWKEYINQIKSIYIGKNILANPDSSRLFNSLPNVVSIDVSNLKTTYMQKADGMFGYDKKLTEITGLGNWDTSALKSINSIFISSTMLTSIKGIGNWNISSLEDMSSSFSSTKALKDISELKNWDISNVKILKGMFNQSEVSNFSPIENWNVSNVTDMSNLFNYCLNLTSIDLSNWKTSSVTNLSSMFVSDSNLTEIKGLENFYTSNVTDISSMFRGDNKILSLEGMENWDVSKVIDMSYVFNGASSLTHLDLGEWNTSNAKDMHNIFSEASNFNETSLLGFNNWDTGKVTNMNSMFSGTGFSTLNLSNFNMSNVISMSGMFQNTKKLQRIIVDKFDTSSVTNMSSLFYGSTINDFSTSHISDWDTSNVQNMSSMFRGMSGSIKSLDLSKWNTSKVTDFYTMFNSSNNIESLDVSGFDMTNAKDISYFIGTRGKLWKITLGPKVILKSPGNGTHGYINNAMMYDPTPGTVIDDTTYSAISDKWQAVETDNGGTDHSPQGKLLSADELMDLYDQPGGPTETYVWQQQPKIDMNMSVPDIDFGRTYNSAGLVKRNDNFEIHVNNNSYPTDTIPAKIEVSMERPLTDSVDSSKTLNDVLIFKGEDNIEKILSATDTEIYDGDIANGSSDLSWDNDHGILLNMNNDRFAQNGHYSTTLNWTLTNSL